MCTHTAGSIATFIYDDGGRSDWSKNPAEDAEIRAELMIGVAASIAGSCTHPLDLTKVRMQTSGDKGMLNSISKTVGANGKWSISR